MPTFYEETDFDITVDDFLEECTKHELDDVIDYLEEMGYLKNHKRTPDVIQQEYLKKSFRKEFKSFLNLGIGLL